MGAASYPLDFKFMTDRSHLVRHLTEFSGRKILCVGDSMLDLFVRGDVTRVSPEAPIPVMHVTHEDFMPGGAGNVAHNLAALGASAHLISITGDDGAAETLEGCLDFENLTVALIADPDRPTTIKTRYSAAGQQLLRADWEETDAVSDEIEDALIAAIEESIDDAEAIILSDYGKGVCTKRVIGAIISRAGDREVIVDPADRNYGHYRGATIITPNRIELENAFGDALVEDEEIETAAKSLIMKCGVGSILVTRGGDGMTLVENNRTTHIPALQVREIFDVSGAGDTVVATFALARAAGANSREAAEIANAAASIVVTKEGTAIIDEDDLAASLHGADLIDSGTKIHAEGAALDQIAAWREKGLKIGFTNGCFDLLHPGHISLLGQARAACDRLVVGLNSDASVGRLKGAGRPIQSEAARAVVIASIEAVDLVVIFEDDTPLSLIKTIRPDVLVKGKDYSEDQIVGGDEVKSYGGSIVLADLVDGHSTSGTIRRMAG